MYLRLAVHPPVSVTVKFQLPAKGLVVLSLLVCAFQPGLASNRIKTRHSQVKVEELADPVALLVTVREVQEATDWLVGVKQHSAS
jgi:hypothetical protein